MRLFSLVCLVVLFTACGYNVPGQQGEWVGGETRSVYVELFVNRTAQPYLENHLTEAVMLELSRSRRLVLTESSDQADVRLTGEITGFSSNALAYGASDRIVDYRVGLQATVRLERNEGEVLWRKSLQRSEDYPGTADKNLQYDSETLASREISARMAEDIMSALLNSF